MWFYLNSGDNSRQIRGSSLNLIKVRFVKCMSGDNNIIKNLDEFCFDFSQFVIDWQDIFGLICGDLLLHYTIIFLVFLTGEIWFLATFKIIFAPAHHNENQCICLKPIFLQRCGSENVF